MTRQIGANCPALHFDQPGLLLAPTDLTFLVVDFVFLHHDDEAQPIDASMHLGWEPWHQGERFVSVAENVYVYHRANVGDQHGLPGHKDPYPSRNKNEYLDSAPTVSSSALETKVVVHPPEGFLEETNPRYFFDTSLAA